MTVVIVPMIVGTDDSCSSCCTRRNIVLLRFNPNVMFNVTR